MEYQVLARKWRPRDFTTLVGQTHVRQALTHALTAERLHHAYLFTGTRGVGKTTLARILAKCLNCETGITATPCLTCKACLAIEQGRCADVLEVDAASNTKVEDMREMLANVLYPPLQCRFKIYLIDEVHMLSGHSFNALLKTLEEPPAHVKFLLATTEPHKLPITVLSRCLQFQLKKMTVNEISQQLATILTAEQITFEIEALVALARAAKGSLRDALSLLEQARSLGNQQVNIATVHDMLGTLSTAPLLQIFAALAQNDGQALLKLSEQLALMAPDYDQILVDLLQITYALAMLQLSPDFAKTSMHDYTQEEINQLQNLAKQFSPEVLQVYYQIVLFGRRDLPLAPQAHLAFDMTLLRMLSFKPQTQTDITPLLHQENGALATPQQTIKVTHPQVTSFDWTTLAPSLPLTGRCKALAAQCELLSFDNEQLQLLLAPEHAALLSATQEQELTAALQKHFGTKITVKIKLAAHQGQTPAQEQLRLQERRKTQQQQELLSDQKVQNLLQTFNATLQEIDD